MRPVREKHTHSWIREGTWLLVDRRAALRKEMRLTQAEGRKLGRRIKASLKADRIERARKAGELVMENLSHGNLREAWRTLRGWYRDAGEKTSKPCYDAMETQTAAREGLYGHVPSPGEPIPNNFERPPLRDDEPEDAELRRAVIKSHTGRSGGGSEMIAEDLKRWLKNMTLEEKAEKDGKEGWAGMGDAWRLLVKLIRHIWNTGDIPQQMLATIVVLIPKGNSGDYRGIGLLEVLWKVIERVLDERISTIPLHDALHGFRAKRGCSTGIMEAKLSQQLAFLECTPAWGIFLDLHKAYDAMDRERCLDILKDAGCGPNILRIIKNFWDGAMMVCRAAGVYGRVFKAFRGVTQGGPLSPTIFNLMVDAVVREWLRQLLSAESAEAGITKEDIRLLMACFYADDGLVMSQDPAMLQRAFDILTGIFDRVGLRTNIKKTEVMAFVPGRVRKCLSADAYWARMDADFREGYKGGTTECEICGKELTEGSMRGHLESQHGIFRSFILEGGEVPAEPRRWEAEPDFLEAKLRCPVPGCPQAREGRGVRDSFNLRWHFASRHPQDTVTVEGECHPRC
jgi:hypothetical protein